MSQLTGILATYADGEVIFDEGDAAADMFMVRSGAVDIVREKDGQREVLERVQPGEFFGELALFSPSVRSATAVAVGETTVEAIDKPTFQAFVDEPLVWAICAKLSERLRRATSAAASGTYVADTVADDRDEPTEPI